MKKLFLILLLPVVVMSSFINNSPYKLIGHRGGVVDSTYAENSMASLEQAYKRGYFMVEIDVRLTKDGKLITQHDPDFKKYFANAARTDEMTWEQIKAMHNNKDGSRPLLLEEVFKYCEGKMEIMLDNKIKGNQPAIFQQIEALLKQYHLLDKAMIIGTDEIRKYFVNKTNVCFNRKMIESMLTDKTVDLKKVLLFEHGNVLTKNDIDWANEHGITVVPTVNKFHYTDIPYMEGSKRDINNLKQWGVTYYQIDSEFDEMLD